MTWLSVEVSLRRTLLEIPSMYAAYLQMYWLQLPHVHSGALGLVVLTVCGSVFVAADAEPV
jgi:hypothetical protein